MFDFNIFSLTMQIKLENHCFHPDLGKNNNNSSQYTWMCVSLVLKFSWDVSTEWFISFHWYMINHRKFYVIYLFAINSTEKNEKDYCMMKNKCNGDAVIGSIFMWSDFEIEIIFFIRHFQSLTINIIIGSSRNYNFLFLFY